MAIVLAVAFVTLTAPVAAAHDLGLAGLAKGSYGLSRSTWKLDGTALTADITLPRVLADHLVASPGIDPATINDAAREGAVTARIDVRRGDQPCGGEVFPPGPAAPGAFRVQVRYSCPGGSDPVRVDLALIGDFGTGHRHLAAVDDGSGSRTEVLLGASPTLVLRAGEGRRLPFSFLTLGIEHILGGYDHLIFLLGLILLGGSLRSLLGTVTAFTLAHSVTLAVAALNIWNPGSAFVEPAIGLTIAYVGIENLFLKEPKGRWRITFILGLVHGFGFASALADAGLARSHVVPALLLFNVGVEAGQILVLAVALPLVLWARRTDWVVARGVPAASVAVALTGLTLFFLRLG